MRTIIALILIAILAAGALGGEAKVQSQELDVRLDPATHRIEGTARLTVKREGVGPWALKFRLHPDLKLVRPVLLDPDRGPLRIVSEGVEGDWNQVRLNVHPGSRTSTGETVVVRYAGEIYDAVKKSEALGFIIGDDTRGVIGEEGVFLVRSSGWYPVTEGVCTFRRVKVSVPEKFRAVTQGGLAERKVANGLEHTTWTSGIPVDGLAMQAGKYVVDTREVDGVSISTYLFADQRRHSTFILDQVESYLGFYRRLLGPYPWPKFDVVSNFFTTGYGMPSYTLLGRQVIEVMVRMAPRYGGNIPPGFVDHELVHCYWGNYVYPDYATGNWCEGLTSYCANYLMKERTGADQATAYRKKICQNFAIRVTAENDYPVRAFRGKTEDFENDIGYGKSAMVFHMLRKRMRNAPELAGPEAEPFFHALREVVKRHGGRKTSWGDFEKIFSEVSGQDHSWFFEQWLSRKGAPEFRLENVKVTREGDGQHHVRGEILQVGDLWRAEVPLVLKANNTELTMVAEVSERSTPFDLSTTEAPISLAIDPEFHVFRKVPLDEIQPCLNFTLESPNKVIVVPAGETPYRGLAGMAKARKGGEIVVAGTKLPDSSCLLFGRPDENPAVAAVLSAAGVTVEGNSVTVKGKKHEGDDLWLLLSTRHPSAEGKFVTVFFGMTEKALARARVIFHFGWDGFLVYRGRPLDRGDFTEISPSTTMTLAAGPDADGAKAIMVELADPKYGGRLAGTEGCEKVRLYLDRWLGEKAMFNASPEFFEFGVKDFDDPDAWTVVQGRLGEGTTRWRTSYPGAAVPAVFSPEAPDGVRITRIARLGDPVDAGTLVVLPPEKDVKKLLALLTDERVKGAGAIAVPMEVLKEAALEPLAVYPSRPPTALKGAKDLLPRVAMIQRKAPAAPAGLTLPVVFLDTRLLPPGGAGEANVVLRVRFGEKRIRSANLRGIIPAGKRTEGPRVVLSAHYDGLGEGHQGADDNASGVAALLLAARSLAVRSETLAAPVEIVFFGAEEFGLEGSAALAPKIAHETGLLVNVDTIGAKDAEEVYVVGRSHHPDLAGMLVSALESGGFKIGRDIDKYAFRMGSDHWPFHEAGVPAVDLFSGVYRRMNTKGDVLSLVDESKVARIADVLATAAADLAKTLPPPDPRQEKVTVFPGEEKHLKNIRRLTFGGENAECYFSPDDALFCFQAKLGSMDADQIFVMGLDGAGRRMVSNGKGATTCSFLFPGAKRLVYATTMLHGDGPPAPPDRAKGYVWKLHPEFEVVVRNADGTGFKRLTDTWGYDAECAVSPDGKWIVFTSCRDSGDPEIYKMRPDGGEVTRLTNAVGYDGGPFFSPDGKKIIFRANRPETPEEKKKYRVLKEEQLISPMRLEIYVMDADGGNQRRITDIGAASFAPYMHPDGKRVIFCSNYGWKPGRGMPNFDLFMVNLDGTGLTRITGCPDFDGFPMFSFDGKRLVFASNRDNEGTRDTNIFIADWVD